jgi:hypothetical protein
MRLRRIYYGQRGVQAYLGDRPVDTGTFRLRVYLVSPQDAMDILRGHTALAGRVSGRGATDGGSLGRAHPSPAIPGAVSGGGEGDGGRACPGLSGAEIPEPEKQRLWETERGEALSPETAGAAIPEDLIFARESPGEAYSPPGQSVDPGFPTPGDWHGGQSVTALPPGKAPLAGPGQGGGGDQGQRLSASTWPRWIYRDGDAWMILQSFDCGLDGRILELN